MMRLISRAILVLTVLASVPLRALGAQRAPSFRFLSTFERIQIAHAARLAHHSRPTALSWLARRPNVAWSGLAPDRQTIEILFRDGAVGAIFHVAPSTPRLSVPTSRLAPRSLPGDATSPRALVLEPFASQLALGPTAGQVEIDALANAGFHVDVYRDSDVSIPLIEGMAQYSVVYMESHSGTCGPPLCKGDDVFVLTGAQVPSDVDQYAELFLDGSMTEGVTDTQPGIIYLAFTSRLLDRHVGTFPQSSIVFINGCDLLEAPGFIGALSAHGASTVYSWNKKVYNFDAEAAADFIFPHLAVGESASAALNTARAAGLGTSLADVGSRLDLFGDPNNTLTNARIEATPTVTPTPSPTSTPAGTPTSTSTSTPTPITVVAKPHAPCKKGYKRVKGKCKKQGKKAA